MDKQLLDQLYRYCYVLTCHRENAYDLLQSSLENYLKYDNHDQQYKKAYLRRIIRNQFIDNTRREKCVEFESLGDDGDVIALDTRPLDNMLIDEEMIDLIGSFLNVSEREIIFLWAVEGYTAKEIANEIESPRGTVLSKIHRLRKKINKKLGDIKNDYSEDREG
ncbi:MAG: RNA polymerase sigma factor [Thiotrichaceae bacterium]|nr:RNA polymerase sigma factor [Thiotrichaceae bacterium]